VQYDNSVQETMLKWCSTNGRTKQADTQCRSMIYWVQAECIVNQGRGNFLIDSLWKTNNWECFCSSYLMDLGPLAPTRWAVRTLTSSVVYNTLLGSSTLIFSSFQPLFWGNKMTNILLSDLFCPRVGRLYSHNKDCQSQCAGTERATAVTIKRHQHSHTQKINDTLLVVDVKY